MVKPMSQAPSERGEGIFFFFDKWRREMDESELSPYTPASEVQMDESELRSLLMPKFET